MLWKCWPRSIHQLAMRFKGRAIWTAGIVFTAAVAALDAAQLSRSRIPDLHG